MGVSRRLARNSRSATMTLTNTEVQKAKAAEKPFKLSDGRGLYLLVQPTGSKLWRWKYRAAGKEKLMALGTYPDVGLAQARDKVDEARKLHAAGGDPMVVRGATRSPRGLPLTLPLHLLLWAAVLPVLNLAGAALVHAGYKWTDSGHVAAVIGVVVLVWAVAIYWFFVPSTASPVRRALYLVAYLLALWLAAACSYWLAILSHAALFGM